MRDGYQERQEETKRPALPPRDVNILGAEEADGLHGTSPSRKSKAVVQSISTDSEDEY